MSLVQKNPKLWKEKKNYIINFLITYVTSIHFNKFCCVFPINACLINDSVQINWMIREVQVCLVLEKMQYGAALPRFWPSPSSMPPAAHVWVSSVFLQLIATYLGTESPPTHTTHHISHSQLQYPASVLASVRPVSVSVTWSQSRQ